MRAKFEVIFLEEAIRFLEGLNESERRKLIFNIDKSRFSNDPRLFKKLGNEIWEFRTKYAGKQFRLLAFWDRRNNQETLVIATHGFLKKTGKVPGRELEKASRIRAEYFK